MKNFWLFEKHKENIEITGFSSTDFRFMIDSKTPFKFRSSINNPFNCVYDWDLIDPSFAFFFDFPDSEIVIGNLLKESKITQSKYIYIETLSDVPVIKTSTIYFVNNWIDFINANATQGSILLTVDMSFLMEFTDDKKYYLFSNFQIK